MKKQVWIAGVAAVLAVGMAAFSPFSTRAEERIPDGVSAGELSLSGLTAKEAEQKIDGFVAEKLAQEIVLTVNGAEAKTKAGDLGLSWENRGQVLEEIEDAGLSGNLIKRYMKKKDLEVNPLSIPLNLTVDEDRVAAFVEENCKGAMAEAADASITRKDGEFVITPAVTGLTVDMDATKQALNDALSGGETGTALVEAAITTQEPKIKTEDLSSIQDVLGTFSTDFRTSGASRSTNLSVGAGKINGHVLMPGEVLSGYECMQPFSVANGYKTATAYENGRSVDSIGGGVCQIATTLYNASLLAELEIVQRQNHSMSVGYVKPSMDAAIAGTYKDIKVKNPYDTPIYVEGTTAGKTLTFTIYGKETRPENRTIKFESEVLSTFGAGNPIEQVDPSLAPGQRVKVDSGHTGRKSRLFKCVYVDGELKERTLLHTDTYNASKAIYRVGPAAPAVVETPPVETAPVTPPVQPSETPAPPETQPSLPEGHNYGPGMGGPGTTPGGPGNSGGSDNSVGPGNSGGSGNSGGPGNPGDPGNSGGPGGPGM